MKTRFLYILIILYSSCDINFDISLPPASSVNPVYSVPTSIIKPINLGSPVIDVPRPKELFWIDSATLISSPYYRLNTIYKIRLKPDEVIPLISDSSMESVISANSMNILIKEQKSIDFYNIFQVFKINLNSLRKDRLIDSIVYDSYSLFGTLLSNGGTTVWSKWQPVYNEAIPDLYYMIDSIPVKFAKGYPIAISPDGSKILYSNQYQLSTIKEYSISSKTTKDIFTKMGNRITKNFDIKYLNKEEIVACYYIYPDLIIENLKDNSVLIRDSSSLITKMVVSPDSKYLALYVARSFQVSPGSFDARNELMVYSVISKELKTVARSNYFGAVEDEPSGCAFSPDSKNIAYYHYGKLYTYKMTR